MNKPKDISLTISIISHGQSKLIVPLLKNLIKFKKSFEKIFITINIPENIKPLSDLKSSKIKYIFNKYPKGFGENHNQAFKECKSKYFCIMNPDIRIEKNIFKNLIKAKEENNVNIFTPNIKKDNKNYALNCRMFPTKLYLLKKHLMLPHYEYIKKRENEVKYTDWVGGMFMLFNSKDYKELRGFDEKYFLYFEDVDICYRANKLGFTVASSTNKNLDLIHFAQRKSFKNIKYYLLYFKSFITYYKKHLNISLTKKNDYEKNRASI